MNTLKSVLTSSAFWWFGIIPTLAIWSLIYFHDTPHKYVGTVIEVSAWDGSAKLKTKTETRKDTLLNVIPGKYERFVLGQVITVWTGGDLFDGIASTEPQY
jgi:hypothetical protein